MEVVTHLEPSVDCLIGTQLRKARELRHQPLTEVASAIGISLQQLQKYETGANRISASMLHAIAQTLDVPVSFFFSTVTDHRDAAHATTTMVVENLSPTKMRFIRALLHMEDRSLELVSVIAKQLADAAQPTVPSTAVPEAATR